MSDQHLQHASFAGRRVTALSDRNIEQIVTSSEVPPMIAALVAATGDVSMLREETRPPGPAVGATIAPHAGMTPTQLAVARDDARAMLRALRDGSGPDPDPDPALMTRIMEYLTGETDSATRDMLARQVHGPSAEELDTPAATSRRVLVIGAGLTGIAAAYRLVHKGHQVTVLESADGLGGTWRDNIYPGCRLDTANFAYSFSFAQKHDWKDHYSEQPAILEHAQRFAAEHGLGELIKFGREVTSMRWDPERFEWHVKATVSATGETEQFVADAVMTATGQLSRPKVPEIRGLDDFTGEVVHSAQWRPDIDVRGKRVAIIGTGASAFQLGPAIAPEVGSLTVYQRSAPWMLPTPEYHSHIEGGLEWLLAQVPTFGLWHRFWQFWVSTEARRPLVQVDPAWDTPGSVSLANQGLREGLLEHLHHQYRDRPDLIPLVTPNYPAGSKRMLRDNGVWGDMLRQDHVEVVVSPIDGIDGSAIVSEDGTRREFDLIAFATGFKAEEFLAPMEIVGAEGRTLDEVWGGDAKAYVTATVPGFPNLFMLGGPNSGLAANGSLLFMTECALDYAIACLDELDARGARAMAPTLAATDEFCAEIDAENRMMAWGITGISTWYQNRFGRVSQNWPKRLADYWSATRGPVEGAYEFLGRVDERADVPALAARGAGDGQ